MLGTLAGFALARYRRFRGRAAVRHLVTAPLVMPEVITGLSLLLLFVALEQAIGWPDGRSMLTIIIAHITLGTGLCRGGRQARLAAFDRSLEEAALDLGARPAKVFLVITLPLIAPALVAGWLLAFTLSLDDLVIASFTSGPGLDDAADGDLLERAPRRQPADQRAGDDLRRRRSTVAVTIAGWLIGGRGGGRRRSRRGLRNRSSPPR